jgi:hypothetical protein
MESFAIVMRAVTIPFLVGGRSPGDRFVFVTSGASVGCSELGRKIGTRDSQAVVPAKIHAHIKFPRHMTVHTTHVAVMCMVFRVVSLGKVTPQAEAVSLHLDASGMGVVAVGANHARVIHLALYERAVDVNLIVDLTV